MLDNLPTIRVITVEDAQNRRNNFSKQISKYTDNYKFITFKKFKDSDFTLEGETLSSLHENSYGPIASHLANLYDWYYTCNDDYCIVMEDDLSFLTLNYWNFTLKEFIEKLPDNWEAVQLVNVSPRLETPEFKNKAWDEWCVAVFIVKRSYVKKIIDKHIINPKKFNVDLFINNCYILPIVENILIDYTNKNVYIFPLFVEDVINCVSTSYISTIDLPPPPNQFSQPPHHYESYEFILNWWKNNTITLQRIFK